SWKQFKTPNPGSTTHLDGVAAVSASNVWAVGSFSNNDSAARTLILHWNGSKWKQVPSPHPGVESDLFSVAASHGSAWAVGDFSTASRENSLILRWNGTRWKKVP